MPGSGSTTNYGFPFPELTDPFVPGGPTGDFQALAQAIDNKICTWVEDLNANIPAAGLKGRFFWALDAQILYYDNGTAWIIVNNAPCSARIFASSTLGYSAGGQLQQLTNLGTQDFSTGAITTGSNTITVTNAGLYLVECNITWGSSSDGQIPSSVSVGLTSQVKVGGTTSRTWVNGFSGVQQQPTVPGVAMINIPAAGAVTLWGGDASPGPNPNTVLHVQSGTQKTWLSVTLISLTT